MVIRTLLLIFVCNSSVMSGQQEELATKNQIGINASKFLLIFNEQVETVDIIYRRQLEEKYLLRTGASIGYSDDGSGIVDLGLQLGVDRVFRTYSHWTFYLGGDISMSYSRINSSDSESLRYGVSSHLGIQYWIGRHFSISTEPSLAFYRNSIDDKGFNPNSTKTWNEVKFLQLGEVIFSFIF